MRLYDFWINGNGGTENENGAYSPFMQFYAEWFKYYFEDNILKDSLLADKVRNTGKTIGCITANIFKISSN